MPWDWVCNTTIFGEGLMVNGYLNVCFGEVFLIGSVNLLGVIGGFIYFFFGLRGYFNYEGTQKPTTLVEACFVLKMICCILTAYQWLLTKGSYAYEGQYPLILNITNVSNMVVWLLFSAILYSEWNRSLPHHGLVRTYFILSTASRAINLISLVGISDVSRVIDYYGSVKIPIVLVFIQSLVAFLMLIGIHPKIQAYIEPQESQEEDQVHPKSASLLELLKLLSAKGSYMGFGWLVLGFAISAAKGYVQQEVNTYDGQLFDAARRSNEDDVIINLRMLMILYSTFAICSGVSMFFCNFGSEKLIHGRNGVRARLFQSLLRQEMVYHNEHTSAELTSRFSSDTEKVRNLLSEYIPELAENISLVCFGSYYLFKTRADLTCYMIGIVPLAFGLSFFQTEKLGVFVAEGQEQNSKMTSYIQDVFSKYQTVMLYGKQEFEKSVYADMINTAYLVFRKKVIFNSVMLWLTGSITWGTQSMAFFLGLDLFNETDNFVDFIVFTLYSMNVVQGLIRILQILPPVGEALGAVSEVIAIINRIPCAPEIPRTKTMNVTRGEIVFENVRFTYPTAQDRGEALTGISFTVKPNSKVAIVGDSGAGKSTIFQLIARFYDVTHGSIRIDDQEISSCDPQSIRKHMALVSQDSDLFSVSLLENILYGKQDPLNGDHSELIAELLDAIQTGQQLVGPSSQTIADIMSAVKDANAHDFIQSVSDLTKTLGVGGSGLSGGQKQRVTIARALYKDPQILLLDEATSALDQISEAVVQQALDNLCTRRTVLVIAHRLNTIKNADKIIVMDKGRIIDQGTHDELMASSVKYKTMVEATKKSTANEREDELIKLFKEMEADIAARESTDKGQKLLADISKSLKAVFNETE